MGSRLRFGNEYNPPTDLDEFFKSLMFQHIMDSDLQRNERDVLLVVLRKTIHYDKWTDKISMHWLGKAAGLSDNTLRTAVKELIKKDILNIKRSNGGKTKSPNKFNEFSLNDEFINIVFMKWINIKIINNFEV